MVYAMDRGLEGFWGARFRRPEDAVGGEGARAIPFLPHPVRGRGGTLSGGAAIREAVPRRLVERQRRSPPDGVRRCHALSRL